MCACVFSVCLVLFVFIIFFFVFMLVDVGFFFLFLRLFLGFSLKFCFVGVWERGREREIDRLLLLYLISCRVRSRVVTRSGFLNF